MLEARGGANGLTEGKRFSFCQNDLMRHEAEVDPETPSLQRDLSLELDNLVGLQSRHGHTP